MRAKLEDEIDEDEIEEKAVTTSEELSSGRKCFNFICGIENQSDVEGENVKSAQDLAIEASEFLKEEPKYRRQEYFLSTKPFVLTCLFAG